jgi:predicted CXXCH cytochrome family protein
MNYYKLYLIILIFSFSGEFAFSQISPGDLSAAHAHLEGVSNCTQCHTVGNKVTREKCLDCHKEIKSNIDAKKGYHASSEVTGKKCSSCHNEHHGRKFKLIRFDKKKFNHAKTGFTLKGQHAKEDCKACHNAEHIKLPKTQRKSGESYIGLSQTCTTCHDDYHQGKLSAKCNDCHSFDNWQHAKTYDHSKTKFPLRGKHLAVKCIDCHKTEIVNGKVAQNFKGLKFDNCNACHEDEHNNRFGQDCKQCHSEVSFRKIKGIDKFDHDKTGYKLIGKHKLVDCKECHKGAMTEPLKHARCTDCHNDEHDGQFAKNGVVPDCNECHSNYGFEPSEFTVERHNKTKFKLDGAHVATACNECHKKDVSKKWQFRNIGTSCVDCHKNVHKGFIDEKYFPEENCEICHTTSSWKQVNFDHEKTGFKLEGAHSKERCGACHYRKNEQGEHIQKFSELTNNCSQCHKDSHAGQFEENGKTDCTQCHGFVDWKDSKYDHNRSRFKLDGQHVNVKCEECHKPIESPKGKYIQYKFKSIECSECHS